MSLREKVMVGHYAFEKLSEENKKLEEDFQQAFRNLKKNTNELVQRGD